MYERIKNQPSALNGDPWLKPYTGKIAERRERITAAAKRLRGRHRRLADFASGHEFFGLHRSKDGWILREWAPNATAIQLDGECNNWNGGTPEFAFTRISDWGVWELRLSANVLHHGERYLLNVSWNGGSGRRIPAFCRCVEQDEDTKLFTAKVWAPVRPYRFKNQSPLPLDGMFVYEAHIGMAQEAESVGSFNEFTEKTLPRIARTGYDTIQLMAVMNHPYYGSFGYHVSNFFAVAPRFGTPDDFKRLVDTAHGLGLRVIMDVVHSHAVKNINEGIALQDGTRTLYFHDGERGEHPAWDSLCFDYGKDGVLHFLLSNCRFWLDEYHIDGFRFDGVTSMLYTHHGLGRAFTGYDDYFSGAVDEDAYVYLALANQVIHEVTPNAVTVAEDVSGMPGLAAPVASGGCGFDYRMAMGVSDCWFKLFDQPDESWNMWTLWHELTNRRNDERTVSYVECHDQSIVGGQTAIFRMIGAAMYTGMLRNSGNLTVERGVALHKMARLISAAAAGNGYLNFMGNEFGHPEWVDFPRDGNNWSCHYARRQWSLAERDDLRYAGLNRFDREMIALLRAADIYGTVPQTVAIDDNRKIIAFERAGLWFFFNFNCTESFADVEFTVLDGEYVLALDSDSGAFDGHGRVTAGQHYFTVSELRGNERVNLLRLYLPNRTALVLRRV